MGEKILGNLKRKILIKVMAIILPLLLLIIIASTAIIAVLEAQSSSNNTDTTTGNANVSAQVLAWKPTVEKYANQFGISQYENLILAVIQQESGGTQVDVMQSSECSYNTEYPEIPNGITDPDYSIYCGVQEIKDVLTMAGVTSSSDIQGISLALQAYNFGDGFIAFAKSRGGYSFATAQAFASSEGGNYGDPNYVPHVLKYYNANNNSGNGSSQLAKVIQIAESEEGKNYVWGTAGPDTFDCSGFVYYCYVNSGFKIQRQTAQDYYNESTLTTNPDVGDLVFFGDPSNIHHIGIYIGNGQMIDAPQTGETVQIENYNWSDFAGFGKYDKN